VYPWFKAAAQALFEIVRGREDVVVCVKTHPHDTSLEDYRRAAAEAKAANVRFYRDRFDELLNACDVLVSGSSTAMLEAILLGRRTICINFSNEPDRYPYVAEGGSLGASSAAELRSAIAAALDPELADEQNAARRRFLSRHVGPTVDGQAARVFTESVRNVIAAAEAETATKSPTAEPAREAIRPASPR
jgi:UDP-N-acetylglucosamine 2-epimerase